MEKTKKIDFEDEDLKNYISELEDDTSLTKYNIKEKALNVSSMRCKWLKYYHFEKENLAKIMKAKEEYTKKKIKSSNISDPLLAMKSSVALENQDEMMVKINTLTKKVKNRIEYLERAQNIMNDFPFSIKNNIDLFKLENI